MISADNDMAEIDRIAEIMIFAAFMVVVDFSLQRVLFDVVDSANSTLL